MLIVLLKLPRAFATTVVAILALLLVGLSQVAIGFAASASYYLLPTRFFELMFGGVLALFVLRYTPTSNIISRFAAVTGLSLIGFSLFFLNKTSAFPGVNAVWPCLGAMLVIWSGCRKGYQFPVLSCKPMVFIGLISYSLYLWHWPIISYLNYLYIEIDAVIGLAVFVSSCLFAWLSWRYIETPFRRSGATTPVGQIMLIRLVSPVLLLACFTVISVQTNGFAARFDTQVSDMEQVSQAKPEILRAGCHVPTALFETQPDTKNCRLGNKANIPEGILIGDSFANHFSGMVDEMANVENATYFDYTMDGCPAILGWDNGNSASYSKKCKERNDFVYSFIKKQKFKQVVIAASWPDSADAGELVKSSLAEIFSSGASITLILDNSAIPNANSCPVRSMMYQSSAQCSAPIQTRATYLADLVTIFPNLHVIDPDKIICKQSVCHPVLQQTLLYRDNVHLNDTGARLLGKLLIQSGTKLAK